MTLSDSELLQQFAHNRSDEAFALLLKRHLDLVYSAALRQVRSSQLAEDIAQSVFLDLSRNADKLKPDTLLTAWLYSVTRRTAIDVVRSESRRQLREQIAVELADMKSPDAPWKEIEPLLDAAMETLDEQDRSSILLRYFENKSLREIGQTLGTSDDAAQKRVSRAVERLREYFLKNSIAVGSAGLATLLSAHAVQAAPLTLAATISSAVGIGLAVNTIGTLTVGKILIMTTAQKALLTTTLILAAGTGIYQTYQASHLRKELRLVQDQQTPLLTQNQQLQEQGHAAARELGLAREEIAKLNQQTKEIYKLRGEAGRLQQSQQELAQLKAHPDTNEGFGKMLARIADDPTWKNQMRAMTLKSQKKAFASLFNELHLTPEEETKLLELMVDKQILHMEKNMALFNGGDKAQLEREIAAAQEKADGEGIALLGEERFQQFKAFQRTVPDRTALEHFKTLLGDTPLNGEQEKLLLQTMIQERAKTPAASRPEAENSLKNFDADAVEKALQAQEQMNQQVRSRAEAFLNTAQLGALTQYQTNQLNVLKMSLNMQQKLLGPKTN
jgi:RNA polymerase sigma factor (sigma-70 family)